MSENNLGQGRPLTASSVRLSSRSVFNWLTEHQPPDGYLLGGLAAVQRWLEFHLSLNHYLNTAVRSHLRSVDGKIPRWVSEIYLLACVLVSILSYSLATPIRGFQWWKYCVVAWAVYRTFDILVFTVGWVFVHKGRLHSMKRSLFGFALNMVELSVLFSTLAFSFAPVPVESKPAALLKCFADMVALQAPTATLPLQAAMETLRLLSSFLLVLVILGGLAGGVLRRSLDATEG